MIYTGKDVLRALKHDFVRYTTVGEMAADIGIGRSNLSDVLHGRRHPPPKVLRWLGFKRIVAYTGTGK